MKYTVPSGFRLHVEQFGPVIAIKLRHANGKCWFPRMHNTRDPHLTFGIPGKWFVNDRSERRRFYRMVNALGSCTFSIELSSTGKSWTITGDLADAWYVIFNTFEFSSRYAVPHVAI